MAALQVGAFILELEAAIVSWAGTAVSATLAALGASFITLICQTYLSEIEREICIKRD